MNFNEFLHFNNCRWISRDFIEICVELIHKILWKFSENVAEFSRLFLNIFFFGGGDVSKYNRVSLNYKGFFLNSKTLNLKGFHTISINFNGYYLNSIKTSIPSFMYLDRNELINFFITSLKRNSTYSSRCIISEIPLSDPKLQKNEKGLEKKRKRL